MDRDSLKHSLEESSLEGLDRQVAEGLLEAIPEGQLDALAELVQNEKLGWKFVVDNFRKKAELVKKNADEKDWEDLFAAEAKALEGIAE